jgi:hypothetical protein
MTKAEEFIESRLIPPLLHGDEKHQQWLKEELRKWIPDLQKLIEQEKAPKEEVQLDGVWDILGRHNV